MKAASDIYLPVSGKVTEVNKDLEYVFYFVITPGLAVTFPSRGTPDLVNKSPYEKGWMVKIKLSNPSEATSLLDSAAYAKVAAADEH